MRIQEYFIHLVNGDHIKIGEADISTMPIEYAATSTPKYNAAICEALGLTAPEGYTAIG